MAEDPPLAQRCPKCGATLTLLTSSGRPPNVAWHYACPTCGGRWTLKPDGQMIDAMLR